MTRGPIYSQSSITNGNGRFAGVKTIAKGQSTWDARSERRPNWASRLQAGRADSRMRDGNQGTHCDTEEGIEFGEGSERTGSKTG
jgi:hypothetical protein